MAKQFTLGKKERLKSRKQIEQLFSSGQRFIIPPFRIFYSFQQAGGSISLQAGFAASSRVFKTAVERNRVKRLTREAYRLQKNELQAQLKEQNQKLNVFFIYIGKEMPAYEEVYKSIQLALTRLTGIVKKRP
ncbi:ribonuclease P protein component [Terrimonas pollutisoli]|uniref:ribonuclease P protein component n=1 Tax=Terrimonas pollutisoli TaxID=3034147 RepID=UPI0023EB23C7|nr:ribonuclease P protein component [Terrimonas sp. H1YJ31]